MRLFVLVMGVTIDPGSGEKDVDTDTTPLCFTMVLYLELTNLVREVRNPYWVHGVMNKCPIDASTFVVHV